MDQTAPDTIDLRDYLQVLARQWKLVAGLTVAVVAVALTASFVQTPVYESSVEVAIEPVRSGADAALEDLLLRGEVIETERRVILSTNVASRVIEDIGLNTTPSDLLEQVSVSVIPNTRVVTITATDTDAAWTTAVANSFADSYLEYRRDRALDEVTAARANLDDRRRELQIEIDAIDRELGPTSVTGGLSPDDQALVAQRDALTQQLAQISIQLASLDPGAEAVRGGGEILVAATTPDAPVSPRPLRTGVLAFVLGLMLGVGAAFLRDHFDDAIRSEDDVKRAADGHAVIGRITAWENPDADQKLITMIDPFAANSEEFQALAANVRFSLLSLSEQPAVPPSAPAPPRGRSVVVTSSGPGEGKTTTAGNLAVASAASGRRVILVGADLRKPTLARRFGLPDGAGLTDALLHAADLSDGDRLASHLIDVGVPRLRVLPAGSIPPNPTELLASSQMTWLHRALVSMADLVIYDTPPTLPVADTLELAHRADLTLIVTRAESCSRRDLAHTVERLQGVGAAIGGVVINGLTTSRSGYGYGYYGYRSQGDEYRPRTTEDTAQESPATTTFASKGASKGSKGSKGSAKAKAAAAEAAEAADAPTTSSSVTVREATASSSADASAAGYPFDTDSEEETDTWLFKNR